MSPRGQRDGWALDYIDVATRIVEFRDKFPDGSLQQVDIRFIDFAGQSWVVFTAAAYRSPTDERPGIGTAWEPVPGKTNFTRDSEVQNAETAAWGRAIVAALAADTRKGIASGEEVRNRQADKLDPSNDPAVLRADIARIGQGMGWSVDRIGESFAEWSRGQHIATADADTLSEYRTFIDEERKRGAREHRQLVAEVRDETQAGRQRKDSPDRGRVERSDRVPDDEFVEPVTA